MRLEEYLKSEESAVRHCASRDVCPFGMICGAGSDDALFPYVFDVAPSDLIWTDLRREHRVFVVQSGLFSCVANLDRGEERPFALLGCGYTSGVAELYVDRGISQSYYLRALTESSVHVTSIVAPASSAPSAVMPCWCGPQAPHARGR